jgi:hypothetical protein
MTRSLDCAFLPYHIQMIIQTNLRYFTLLRPIFSIEKFCSIFHYVNQHDFIFNYGFEYFGLGKVIWYQQNVSMQIARVPRVYVVSG